MIGMFRSVRGRRDEGASAVEFALILPILALLVFGIIDYGLWFADSISMRQGVREAARQGIVANFDADPTCTTGSNGQKLACLAENRIGALTGDPAIKIVAPANWEKGEPLIVCAQMKSDGLIGFVPLPRNEVIASEVQMAVENTDFVVGSVSYEDSPPTGEDWTWCG